MIVEQYALFRSPIGPALQQLFAQCRRSLFIACPFISVYGVSALVDPLVDRISDIAVEVLTCLSVGSLESGALDLDALVYLGHMQPDLREWSLPQLHAKVYVVDDTVAMITSANLTHGGLQDNYEYGVALSGRSLVAGISDDMRAYASLGSAFDVKELQQLAHGARELQAMHRDLQRHERRTAAGRRYHAQQLEIEEALLRMRVKDRPITAIFAETIRYLLRAGPMTTQQLHLRIKEIHSDICDDTVDRVINGQRFGKLWKHHVRNAQQFLKGRGEIILRAGRWELSRGGSAAGG